MASGAVQDSIADDYLKQFDRSLGVSAIQKLTSWKTLQNLGFNGQLTHMNTNFHGVKDFKSQMAKYSSSHYILRIAWSLISSIALNNASILRKMFVDPVLGQVGSLFKSIHSFGQVFGVPPDELNNLSAITSKAQSYSSQAIGLTSNPTGLQGAPVPDSSTVVTF